MGLVATLIQFLRSWIVPMKQCLCTNLTGKTQKTRKICGLSLPIQAGSQVNCPMDFI